MRAPRERFVFVHEFLNRVFIGDLHAKRVLSLPNGTLGALGFLSRSQPSTQRRSFSLGSLLAIKHPNKKGLCHSNGRSPARGAARPSPRRH